MLKRILNITFLFCSSIVLNAQFNLVPNYSFEEKESCPTWISEISVSCSDWFTPMSQMNPEPTSPWYIVNGGSSDYFHVCGVHNYVKVPKNGFGYQLPKTDSAYSGFVLILNDTNSSFYNHKEYIEVELKTELEKGKMYYAELYYSIAEYVSFPFYSNARVSMLFTDTIVSRQQGIVTGQPQMIRAIPQVSDTLPFVKDTSNWIKLSGVFRAKGGEQYLTIGNFQDEDPTYSKSVYVYIDDVSVYKCDTCIIPEPNNNKFRIYPVPTLNKQITVEHINGTLEGFEIAIYDATGKLVYQYDFSEAIDKKEISILQLRSGVYIYAIRTKQLEHHTGKLVVL